VENLLSDEMQPEQYLNDACSILINLFITKSSVEFLLTLAYELRIAEVEVIGVACINQLGSQQK